ncbi:MAG: hypothetical protein RIR88_297 [Actinomycetota bacterium]
MTWGFLVLAVYSVFSDLSIVLDTRGQLVDLYTALGDVFAQAFKTTLAPFPSDAFPNTALLAFLGWASVTVEAIVLGLTVWYSLARMRAKKLSWWVPVVGLFGSSMLINITLTAVFFSDAAIMTAVKAAIP